MKKRSIICLFIILTIIIPNLCFPISALSFDPGIATTTEAITLMNLDTGTTVYEKNSDKKMYPASLTKVMTYIITVENILDLDNTNITVSEKLIQSLQGTDSSLSDIMSGETLSVYELLNCLMIPSGNDAATVLADYVGNGNISDFVQMMNKKAETLGCTNTHFVNPTGLHDVNHYTTSNDFCKITKYAMQLPYFMTITSQTEHIIPKTNKQESRTLVTTNKMMLAYYEDYYYKYVTGIKTGWHDDAGYCIVSSATADGYSYLCAALGAPSLDASGKKIEANEAMIDSKNLFRWALTTFEIKPILDVNKPIDEIALNYAWGKDTLLLSPEKNINYLLPKDVKASSITTTVTEKPSEVDTPVKKGEVLGKAKLSYANQDLMEINIVSDSDVSRSDILYYLQVAKNIFSSVWFIVILCVFVVFLIAYIIVSGAYNRKTNRKVKKYRNF